MLPSQKLKPYVFPQSPRSILWTKATKSLLYQEIWSQTQTLPLSRHTIPSDREPLALPIECLTVAEVVLKLDPSPTPSLPPFSPSLTWLCLRLSFIGTSIVQVSDKAAPLFPLLFLTHLTHHICGFFPSSRVFWDRNIEVILPMLTIPHTWQRTRG